VERGISVEVGGDDGVEANDGSRRKLAGDEEWRERPGGAAARESV
jgi:hypothetical protein